MELTPRRRHDETVRVVAAMGALILAGSICQVLLLLGLQRLGLTVVLPAMAALVVLWHPGRGAAAIVLLVLALEFLIPLQTGGGRVQDWLLHFEISRHYAGLATDVRPQFLASRTALFHQLMGGLLAWSPTYWLFQVGAAVLNTSWLWPAYLLIRDHRPTPGSPKLEAPDRPRPGVDARLIAVGLGPFVLSYSIYTWPWGFSAFFLLGALWLASRPGRLAAIGVGTGLAGAILAHPGSIGYVTGLAIFVVVRHRSAILPALASGSAVLLSQVPWMLSVTGGRGPLAVLQATDTAQQRVPVAAWVLTRVLVALHTLVPQAPLLAGSEVADAALALFTVSLFGAVGVTLLAARASMRPTGALAWMVVVGALVGWAIDPPQQYLAGMLDVLYLACLALLVNATAAIQISTLRGLVTVQAALAAGFIALLLLVAVRAPGSDPNLMLKDHYHPRFLVETIGPLPGVVLLAAAGVLAGSVIRRLRALPVGVS